MSDPERDGIPCLWMRGGTSKGAYFLAADLPADPAVARRAPPPRHGLARPAADRRHRRRRPPDLQGRDPRRPRRAPTPTSTTSSSRSSSTRPIVTDAQPCGNILAGVGPAAIERGLVPATGDDDPGPHPHAQHRRGGDREGRDAGRPGDLRRDHRHRRRPRHRRRHAADVREHRRLDDRRAAPDRQRRRRDRRRRLHADRQRHALRGPRRRRRRRHRDRDPRGARGRTPR